MIANVSAHRRANAFAQALEEQSDQGTAAERWHEETAPEQYPRPAQSPGPVPPRGQVPAPGPVTGPGPAPGPDPAPGPVPGSGSVPGHASAHAPGAASGAAPGGPPTPGHARDSGAARDAGTARLLAVAAELGALPKPQLDPAVKAVQRAQLVAAMEAMLSEGTVGGPRVPDPRSESSPAHRSRSTTAAGPDSGTESGAGSGSGSRGRGAHRAGPLSKFRPRSRLGRGLTAGGISIGVAAASFGGVAAASSDALPGDSLYGLKRGIEDFRLNFTDGADERGRAYLDQASTRLNEARRLMERGRGGQLDHESVGEIRGALSRMTEDASEGHRLLHEAYAQDPDSLGPIQALSSFSRSHRDTWGRLRPQLPVQLGDVSEQVTSVFDAIDQEVEPLQALLPESPEYSGGSSQRLIPGTDDTDSGSTAPGRSATPSSGDSGTSSGEGHSGSTTKPKPSASASASEGGGLLGGGTGGLLDPPKDDSTSSTPPSDGKTPTSEPQITLPPLLPGLLPGLGIEAPDTEE